MALLLGVGGNISLFSAEVTGESACFGDPLTCIVGIGVSMLGVLYQGCCWLFARRSGSG